MEGLSGMLGALVVHGLRWDVEGLVWDLRVSGEMWGGGHQLRWDMGTSVHPSTPSPPLWQNRGIYMFRINNEHVIDATLTGGPAR